METPSEYIGLLVTFIIAASIAGLILLLNKCLGPKNKGSEVKSGPFECGLDPFDSPNRSRLSVKFYLMAMLFILFDVEIVWFFPWAVALKSLRWTGIFEMFSFAAVLLLGFAYAWKKGALEWEK
jgi:NADH-quinone oxidoreductase subunit A